MTTMATAPTPPGRGLHITLWILQVLLAAMFIFAGLPKLVNVQPEVIEGFEKIGLGQWFRVLIGVLEVAGGVGLLIPPLSGLAAIGLVGIMIGAVVVVVFKTPPAAAAAFPAAFGALLAFVAWGRWPQTQALLGLRKS
jgi:putative oxidoreductase